MEYSNTSKREVTIENVKKEVENLMSLQYMADTPTFVSKLDSDGYMPLSYLLSLPSIECFGITKIELLEAIKSIDTLSLSSDNSGVRISLPVARKTLIIRDTPEETTENMIRELLSDFVIESIKEEIGHCWFVTLADEKSASEAIKCLQNKVLLNHPVKARIKSEFYIKVFMKRLQSVMASTKADVTVKKLSPSAEPFEVSSSRLKEIKEFEELHKIKENNKQNDLLSTVEEDITGYGTYWNDVTMYPELGFEYYAADYEMNQEANVPFVPTSPRCEGYTSDFIKYTPEEILAIVHEVKDLSLPPIATPGDHSLAIDNNANIELVQKGRTESIDLAFSMGHPRTLSVDSVDYTNMIEGEVEEEVATYVRKQRRNRNRRRMNQKK